MSTLPVRRWVSAASVLVALAAVAVMAYFAHQWWLELAAAGLQDAHVYLNAGRDVLEVRDVYAARDALPYTYPPLWALVCAPLALLPADAGVIAFAVVSAALCWWVLRRVGPRGPRAWIWVGFALLSAPIGRSLYLGQVNPFIVAMVLADAVALPIALRGVGTGLAAAVKVTPAFLALTFLVQWDWRSVGRALAAFAVATGLAFLALPEASRQYWGELLWQSSRVGELDYPDNQSLLGLASRLWDPQPATLAARVATVVVLVLCWRAVSVQHRAGSALLALAAAGIGAALVSPVSWSHHWVWLVIVSALLWRARRPAWSLVVLAPLVATPLWLAQQIPDRLPVAGVAAAMLLSLPTLAGLAVLVVMATRPLVPAGSPDRPHAVEGGRPGVSAPSPPQVLPATQGSPPP